MLPSRLTRAAVLPALLLGAVLAAAPPASEANEPKDLKFATFDESKREYEAAVAPFVKKHCAACHNKDTSEGDLDLVSLDADMKASTSGARWAMVVEKLASGEMPPKGKPRPASAELVAVGRWAHAEAKRAGKNFARRQAYANGNAVSHATLFEAHPVPAFDGGNSIRRLSPEIYAAFTNDLAKGKTGIGQPFSPEGKFAFKDMGAPKIDEPVAAQLIQNALAIVEVQTAHKIEDGKVKAVGQGPKELLALFDPAAPPTDAQMEAAIAFQFNAILRRAPTASEKQRFVALMKKNVADAGRTVGARYALAAVLLLPEAVFRMEVGSGKPDAQGRVRLAPRDIAFALAYTLTDKRPDAELLAAAATGALDTDAGVRQQAARLLESAKTDKPRVLRFFREYFGYGAATDVFKEMKENPEHDSRALVEDTDRLVLWVLERDNDVLRELLTTNKSFVAYKTAADTKKKRADALAKFEADKAKDPAKFANKQPPKVGRSVYLAYGLKDFPDAQPVDLPAAERAGVLTQPSWLVAHSTSFDNHAIHRGKWVRERLLGGVVPDIPITVDAQLPDAPHHTLRERMAVTQQEYCWKCHRLMNDVGYPFEQFDHYGRFRALEQVQDVEATKKNVDKKGKPLGPVTRDVPANAKGLIAHTNDPALDGPVNGAADLMKRLAGSARVEQVFVRHAFRYFTGRNESPGDAATLRAVHRAYRDSGGSFNALVAELLSSESFLYRIPTK